MLHALSKSWVVNSYSDTAALAGTRKTTQIDHALSTGATFCFPGFDAARRLQQCRSGRRRKGSLCRPPTATELQVGGRGRRGNLAFSGVTAGAVGADERNGGEHSADWPCDPEITSISSVRWTGTLRGASIPNFTLLPRIDNTVTTASSPMLMHSIGFRDKTSMIHPCVWPTLIPRRHSGSIVPDTRPATFFSRPLLANPPSRVPDTVLARTGTESL